MKKSPLHTDVETWIRYNSSINKGEPPMSKEMLFLCDVYDKYLDENDLSSLISAGVNSVI